MTKITSGYIYRRYYFCRKLEIKIYNQIIITPDQSEYIKKYPFTVVYENRRI